MIIYEANETDFFNNGLGTLPDATSALVTEERNGEFVLDVIYPQQGLRSELLTKSRIIKADAGHELKDQRFVIKKVTPTMDSDGYIYLTVHAEHVSYITADLGVTPNLTLSGNATQALEQWQANLVGGHPDIVVDSDIISEHETNLDITKATNARQVLGGVEGSILDTWGGEYKFDNLHISLRGQRGTTANTLISYGRNLLTFEQEDDITDTYTSIYPYANVGLADGNNSKLVTVDGYFVDSQYVDRYPNRKLLPVDFGSEFTDYKIGSKPSESDTGIYTTEAEIKKKLVELAKQYIENNRIGIPKVSTKITFADLSKTSEYAPLEQVNLCDIIPIRFEKLGIDTTIKVTRVVWNVLLDEYDSIELGDLRTTLGESISALESKTTGLANAVITAQSTADNQNSIFRTNGGTTEPVAKKTGDLWFKTDGDYQYMYQWDGAVWREVVNTKTTDDIAKEVDQARVKMEELVKKANDDTTIFRTEGQEAAPTVKKKGDLWFKADNGQTVMNEWDGQKWHEIVSTKTTEDITKQVEQAQADAEALSSEVESAKKQAQEAFAKAGFNADEINNVKTATSEVTETLTSTVRQTSELSESLKNVASETASRYSTVSSELSGARDSLNAKASELASEVASNSANITKANSQLYSQSEGLAKVSQSATKMEQTMTDLSGRVHTVETTASETKEALADAKGNITTLTKRADGTDTKIADAQGRVQTLESRADNWDLELSKKVDNTTYNAGIQNLGNQINLKANKSDLDGYATKAQLSVESDRITQQASAISSVTTIANGANLKIDNLSFGGRNLLDRSDGQFVMGNGITNTTWENGKAVLRYNSADVSRSSEILPQSADFGLQFPVARGEQLTQSIYLDTDANINFNNNFEFSWFDFKDGHKLVRANIDKIGQNTYRLWGNYTWDKNDSSNLRIMDIANLYKVVDFRNSGTYLAFYHPQLELGNKASDWSLSQNDVQKLASKDTASQISQYNTGTVQPIKGIANDALGKANTANNKIDGLKIGSRNLLKGTSDQFKTITAWGWMNAHTYSNYPYVDLSNFHTGDYLTYSVWVTNTSDVPIRAEIYCFDKNKGHTHTALSAVINPNNSNWLVVTMPIESNDRYARPSVITTSGQIGSHIIRMREEMLTSGNVRLPWQPSDLDLPATIVTTVTETSNAKQIIDSWGIHTEINSVKTETTGKINEVNNWVSDVSGKVDNVNNKIDNLKVGGRNLLDNSSFAAVFDDSTGFHTKWNLVNSGYATWSFDSDVPFGSGGDRSLMVQIKSPGSDTARGIMYQSPIVKMNTEYTISFWAKARANGMKIEVESNAKRAQFNLSTSWQKYEGVITFQSDNRTLYIHNSQGGAVGQFLIFHPQLELGNKASDWSLSQNDVQKLASKDTASQISQYNTGTVQPIKGIANDALGKANTANNKIDGLKIGSRNLLKGTSDQFKTITAWGWMNAHTYSNYPYVDLSNFHTGDYLTYSVWVTNTSDVPIRAEIYCFDKNKGHTHTALSAVINPNNSNWLVVTMPIESNDRYARPSVITTSGQIGSHIIRMREEMLTLGNVRLPWQPSDLDLPDTIITTVTTTTNAKQIVDNSGIYSEVAKLVDTKVGGVTTQLNSYKHTVDDTGNKLRDVMGALKLDSNGNLTSNFNELIKTASGVEERYTQLNGKIDGLGGGVNLARGTKRDLQNANVAGTWLFIGYNTSSYFNDLSSYQGKHITVRVWIERPTADAWVQIYTNKGTIGGNHIKAGQSGYSTASGVIPTGITSWNIPIGGGAPTMSFGWKEFKIELGEIATPWTPAFEDISTEISKTNETIKTVDGTVATVKNNLDKTKSIVTQLSNLFGVNVGDSSISVTNGGVLVKGKQISIDGNTYIKDASIDGAKIKSLDAGKITTGTLNAAKLNVINLNADSINAGTLSGAYLHITKDSYIDNASIDGAKIKSLDAGKITTGTLNAASVKVINLDANNIKTGTLSGNNLSLNLDDGTVSFKKGKIVSSNNKLILNIDDGSLAVGDASKRQGMMFNQGKMYMYDQGYFGNSTWNGNVYDWILEMKKHPYAVLEYSSSFSGTSGSLFGGSGANFHSTSGVAIAYDKNVSQTASAGTTSGIFDDWNPLDGHGVFINENGIAMGAEDKLVSIVGGTSFRYGQQSIWNYKPTILVGTNLWTDNVYDHGYNINKLTSDGSNIYMQASALITDTSAAIFNVKNGDVEFAIKGNDRNVIINASGHTSNGLIVKGSQNITNWLGCQDLSVRGNKNSVVQTSQGWTKINAYETAEYYFGDLGTAVTDDTSTVRIGIEPLFNETVNTDIPYQVFVTSYGEGYAWVAERGSNYFVIKSSVPNLEIGYEIKAKRKGYENVRLEIDKHMEINK